MRSLNKANRSYNPVANQCVNDIKLIGKGLVCYRPEEKCRALFASVNPRVKQVCYVAAF